MYKLKEKYEILTENNKRYIVYKEQLIAFYKDLNVFEKSLKNLENENFCLDLLQMYLEHNNLIDTNEGYSI